jgi:uncharacterized membrane protein YfcA
VAITLALVFITAVAFAAEAALGFGATVIALSLAALVTDVDTVLAALVPLNLALSSLLLWRGRRDVLGSLFLRRIVPLVLLGMPLGLWLGRSVDGPWLVRGYGAFVFAFAARELWQMRRDSRAPPPVAWAQHLGLFVGGVVHGAFATGGPAIVWALGREAGERKEAFRATLALLWLTLNLVFVTTWVWQGRINTTSLTTTLWLVPGLFVGAWFGDRFFRRASPQLFRAGIFSLLLVAGLLLVVR